MWAAVTAFLSGYGLPPEVFWRLPPVGESSAFSDLWQLWRTVFHPIDHPWI